MSPPRRAPHVQWKINLDATLAARVENALWDPIHGKPRYAERSRVISELLEGWLDRSSTKPTPVRYTTVEGDNWTLWTPDSMDAGDMFAIEFSDGSIFDTKVGWRRAP